MYYDNLQNSQICTNKEIKTGKKNDLQTKSRRCISRGINKRQRIHHERKKIRKGE